MADYHTTYKGLEGDTTQWEDIHRKLGNLPPKPAPHKPAAYEPEAEEVRDSKWLGGKAEEELEELEDDFKDDQFLERYRQQRLKEMQELASKPRFGTMELIRGSEFLAQVTNAGEGFYVVVFLFKEGVPGCTVLEGCLNDLAGRYPHTKFVRIISTDCIPNYPDNQLPTVILYREADLVAHMAGLAAFGGKRTTPQQVALALNQHGPVCSSGADAREDDAGERQHLQEAALRGLVEQLVLDRERRQLSSGDEDSDFD